MWSHFIDHIVFVIVIWWLVGTLEWLLAHKLFKYWDNIPPIIKAFLVILVPSLETSINMIWNEVESYTRIKYTKHQYYQKEMESYPKEELAFKETKERSNEK